MVILSHFAIAAKSNPARLGQVQSRIYTDATDSDGLSVLIRRIRDDPW